MFIVSHHTQRTQGHTNPWLKNAFLQSFVLKLEMLNWITKNVRYCSEGYRFFLCFITVDYNYIYTQISLVIIFILNLTQNNHYNKTYISAIHTNPANQEISSRNNCLQLARLVASRSTTEIVVILFIVNVCKKLLCKKHYTF